MAGSHSVHGAKLGGDEIAGLKKELGFDPAVSFPYEAEVLAHARTNAATRAVAAKAEWSKGFDAWRAANPVQGELFDRLVAVSSPTCPPLCRCSLRARRPPVPPPARCSARSPRLCPSCGGFGRPRRLQQHHHEGPEVLPAARAVQPRVQR